MIRHYHVYECSGCIMTFAVEVSFEDQSVIVCPSCGKDEHVEDIGHGEMVEVHVESGDDE